MQNTITKNFLRSFLQNIICVDVCLKIHSHLPIANTACYIAIGLFSGGRHTMCMHSSPCNSGEHMFCGSHHKMLFFFFPLFIKQFISCEKLKKEQREHLFS